MQSRKTAVRLALVLVAGASALVLSCSTTLMVGDLVEPVVTEVSLDGKTAKVNVGAFDRVHVAQPLYAVRGNEPIASLVVRKVSDYSAECSVRPIKATLLGVRKGDRVVMKFKEVTRPADLRTRVPRMVPVPYNSDNSTVHVWGRDITIPRDQVDEWIRTHPVQPAATNP